MAREQGWGIGAPNAAHCGLKFKLMMMTTMMTEIKVDWYRQHRLSGPG
jgi:hypothetical protein